MKIYRISIIKQRLNDRKRVVIYTLCRTEFLFHRVVWVWNTIWTPGMAFMEASTSDRTPDLHQNSLTERWRDSEWESPRKLLACSTSYHQDAQDVTTKIHQLALYKLTHTSICCYVFLFHRMHEKIKLFVIFRNVEFIWSFIVNVYDKIVFGIYDCSSTGPT